MKLHKIFGPIVVCVGGGQSWSRNSRYNKLAITKPVPVVVILSSYFFGASTIKNIFQNWNFQSWSTKITRCLKSLFWDIDTFVLKLFPWFKVIYGESGKGCVKFKINWIFLHTHDANVSMSQNILFICILNALWCKNTYKPNWERFNQQAYKTFFVAS